MRSFAPRPVLLVLTLVLVAGAIAFIELRLDATSPVSADAGQNPDPPVVKEQAKAETSTAEQREKSTPLPSNDNEKQESPESAEAGRPDRAASDAERISGKEREYRRAEEIVDPSGFVNANGFSMREAAGEKVVYPISM